MSLWLEETWSDFNIFDTKVKTYFRNLQSKARLFLSPRVTGATLQNRKHGNRIFSFARVTVKMSAAYISFWRTMQYRSICDLNFAVYRCCLKLFQLAWNRRFLFRYSISDPLYNCLLIVLPLFCYRQRMCSGGPTINAMDGIVSSGIGGNETGNRATGVGW